MKGRAARAHQKCREYKRGFKEISTKFQAPIPRFEGLEFGFCLGMELDDWLGALLFAKMSTTTPFS